MTEDLIELLQPHLENPELEKKRQEEERLVEQDRRKKEEEEKQKRQKEMIKEIGEAAIVMKKILQNSCTITIAKKMMDDDGGKGMINAKLSVPHGGKGKTLIDFSGISFKEKKCIVKGLDAAMNQEEGSKKAFDNILHNSCIEVLHDFLSTDNVKVTYK